MTRSSFVILTILGFSAGDAAVRAQTIYWTDWTEGTINRFSLTGSGIETLVTGLKRPTGIALDLYEGKMYWAEVGFGDPNDRSIKRANLDGSKVEDVVTNGFLPPDKWGWYPSPQTVALDRIRGKIYWGAGILQRSNLDGSDIETVFGVTSGFGPFVGDLALDLSARKIYYVQDSDCIPCSIIRKVNMDGSNPQFLSVDAGAAVGLDLDLTAGKVYWTSWAYFENPSRIQRANLDGSDEETIITITGAHVGQRCLAVDPLARKIYWMEAHTGILRSGNLDGSNVQTLVTTESTFPSGIAIVPDAPLPALLPEPDGVPKNRFLSFSFPQAQNGTQWAVRVTLVKLYNTDPADTENEACPPRGSDLPELSAFEGQVRWAAPPDVFSEGPSENLRFLGSALTCCPEFRDWNAELGAIWEQTCDRIHFVCLFGHAPCSVDTQCPARPVLHVYAPAVVPCSEYEIQLVDLSCPDLQDEACYSDPLTLYTSKWADVIRSFGGSSQPNFTDIGYVVDTFRQLLFTTTVQGLLRENIAPAGSSINFTDIGRAVEGFKSIRYPEVGPSNCAEPCE